LALANSKLGFGLINLINAQIQSFIEYKEVLDLHSKEKRG